VKSATENSEQNIVAIVPARLSSTRLPNKLLLPIAGKPLILWTVEQAKKARCISRVIVAADSEEIFRVVESSGGEALMTSANHQSGSDRIAEVAETLPAGSIVVNVQGDEPLIHPSTIERAVEAILENDSIQMATTCERIDDVRDILSSDVVKVVADEENFALYFSRSPIPFPREAVKKFGGLENALRADENLFPLFSQAHGTLRLPARVFAALYENAADEFGKNRNARTAPRFGKQRANKSRRSFGNFNRRGYAGRFRARRKNHRRARRHSAVNYLRLYFSNHARRY
jgi:3-deoxy-D-manno-octulosonate cytidylyltransferase